MAKFPWRAEYDLHIEVIDRQHRKFFDIINELEDLLDRSPLNPSDLTQAIAHLEDYAFYHFTTEEGYFAQFSFGKANDHTKHHEQFRSEVKSFSQRAGEQNVDTKALAHDVAQFTVDWLVKHIFTEDREYVPCFWEHGLK